jgi:SAM-dependent methyltransferase
MSDALRRLTDAYAARALASVDAAAVLPLYARHLLGRWRARSAPGAESPSIDELVARVRAEVDPVIAEFVTRCGEALPDVITGEIDPLELYLAGDTTRFLYETSPVARRMNNVLSVALVAAGPARVLEIGAGTGGTARALLAAAPHASYTFTDVSTTLLRRAQRRMTRPGMLFLQLDVERDPATQGIATGAWDAVVAANALHATRDVDEALAHACSLLAPQGVLLLWEAEREETWFDVTVALLPGWHRHADAHRRDSPLLRAEQWEERMRYAGLAQTASVVIDGQAAVVGRRTA